MFKYTKSNNFYKPEASLKRLGDILINRLLLSVQEVSLSTVLVMKYSDGTIEFRDRSSMIVLSRDDITKQVSSLFQVGFDFLAASPSKLLESYCLSSARSLTFARRA